MNPLDVKLEGAELVIRIPVDTLAFAAQAGEMWPQDDMMNPTAFITDETTFAKEVVHALTKEEEDGTTLVHRMFDAAFTYITENGCDGVEWNE